MIKKILIPGDPVLFKQALLKTQWAKRTIIYKDGSDKVEREIEEEMANIEDVE